MLIDSVVEAVFLSKDAEDLGFWRVLKKKERVETRFVDARNIFGQNAEGQVKFWGPVTWGSGKLRF